ncbi:MAG: efflux RND transporter periplasmic adaptor subunit [Candidatus Polarisedimenticolia bacterium]
MGRLLKLLLVLAVVVGAAYGVYAFFQGRKSGTDGMKIVDVARGSVTEKALATGQIEPRLKFHVKSKISGIVKQCFVQVGDVVRTGDPLFEIQPDPTPGELIDAEGRLRQAQVAFDRADADFKRIADLAKAGVVSRGDLDAAREANDRTKTELAQAKDNLELTRRGRIEGRGAAMESVIRATEAGVVLERIVNPGDPVVPLTSYQAGTDMATIADMGDLIFRGTVDEIDVGKLSMNLPARLKIGSLPDAKVTGKLSRVAPQAKEKDNARLFEVEIELDPSPGTTLRAGYSSTADLVIREKRDVTTVPERLVHFEDGGKKAWVETPANVPGAPPKKVDVQTGLSDGLNVEIVSGLKPGDKVVERPPREIGPS